MSTMTDKEIPFPIDWNEWKTLWDAWKLEHADRLRPTSFRFPGQNLLADEKLGTFSINGRNVELSEVTFPNLSERDENGRLKSHRVRYVGITFGTGAGTDAPDNPVVGTFADLERELGL